MSNKEKSNNRSKGIKELIGGAVIAIIGAVVSKISYDTARPGETYTVYTGIIALGVVYAIKGIIDIIFPNGFKKKDSIETAKETEQVESETVKEED